MYEEEKLTSQRCGGCKHQVMSKCKVLLCNIIENITWTGES
jgi:hypothetical protein